MDDTTLREEFVAYQRSKGYVHGETFYDDADGYFEYPGMQEKWEAWQASAQNTLKRATALLCEGCDKGWPITFNESVIAKAWHEVSGQEPKLPCAARPIRRLLDTEKGKS